MVDIGLPWLQKSVLRTIQVLHSIIHRGGLEGPLSGRFEQPMDLRSAECTANAASCVLGSDVEEAFLRESRTESHTEMHGRN